MLAKPDTVRVAVTVTFLRMDHRPPPGPSLPIDCNLVRLQRCTVPFYRYLYGTVGAAYLWWLRRTLSDATIGGLMAEKDITVHVLYRGGEPAGFFEIDRRARPVTNLSYFGLMPHEIGRGVGAALLSAAIEEAWDADTEAVTVNTCTADHPRALPFYVAAGFTAQRRVNEVWQVPLRLGLVIPRHLLV